MPYEGSSGKAVHETPLQLSAVNIKSMPGCLQPIVALQED